MHNYCCVSSVRFPKLCCRLLLHFRKLPKIPVSYFCCTVVLLCRTNIGCFTVSAFFSQPFGTIDAFPFAEPLVYVFSISIRALTRKHHHQKRKYINNHKTQAPSDVQGFLKNRSLPFKIHSRKTYQRAFFAFFQHTTSLLHRS